jgi:hypothetical protein
MPALCLSSFVLQGEAKDGIALFDRVFSFSVGGRQSAIDHVEGLGRGKRVYPGDEQFFD